MRPSTPTESTPGGLGDEPRSAGGHPGDDAALGLTRAADIVPRNVDWLWSGRIPLGKVTVLDGRPAVGKSTISIDLAARLTTGSAMPGEAAARVDPSAVIILTAEDDWADTVVPRLIVARANLDLVYRLDEVDVPDGHQHLEEAVREHRAKLVVIDPLTAFVPKKFNLYVDQDARLVLRPLAALAESTSAAILALRHLKKGLGASAQDQGTGSVAIGGAARSVLLAGRDPDLEGQFALASIKVNVARPPQTLSYAITSKHVQLGDTRAEVSGIDWGAAVSLTADDLVAEEKQGEAVRFLKDILADGPKAGNEVKEAARAKGMSVTGALRRASDRLGVIKETPAVGVAGSVWTWRLPS